MPVKNCQTGLKDNAMLIHYVTLFFIRDAYPQQFDTFLVLDGRVSLYCYPFLVINKNIFVSKGQCRDSTHRGGRR